MRRRKFFRVSAVALAAALSVMSIPVMATESESVDVQHSVDTIDLNESGEDFYDSGYTNEGEDLNIPVYLDDDQDPEVTVPSIGLDVNSLTLTVNDTYTLTTTIEPLDAIASGTTWTSSDESIVMVDDSGNLTAISAGTATVTVKATINDVECSDSCVVTVEPETVQVTSIKLSEESVTLHIDDTYTLTASLEPSDATDQSVTWTSSDESIVTVNDGVLYAVASGTATVTVVPNANTDLSAVCEVTVSGPQVTGITLNKDSLTMNIDESYTLTATITPSDAGNQNINWASSDTSVVTVDANGNIKAMGDAGKATITAAAEDNPDCKATCTVTVKIYSGFQQALDGNWYYYQNGSVKNTTDIIKDTVGTIGDKGTWWYVVKGKVTPGITVAKNSNGWYYIDSEGKVDFSYNGFASNSNGSWYIENGKVTFGKNGVIKDTTGAIGTKGTWYYVLDSKVQTSYTGLADYKNENGWWYIKNGQVDFTANTVAKNKNGWYYVEGGKVRFDYNGFATNSNGSWYVENGKVSFNKNSVIKDTTGVLGTKGTWYYVVGNKVQYDFTGLANYKNENGWYYIRNGQVDFSVNTVAKNKNGWYYVTGGKVQFGFTGLANYKNDNGWWYIKNGKVDFSATGVYKNKNGWYYVSGGKVDFSFNGIASNSNGRWVIKNGKVDFSYNGTYTYGGSTYNVTNGKATFSYESMGMSSSMYNKAQSQSSSTRWLIMVDVDNCKLGIFQGSYGNWTPYKCWDCTTGASGSPTCRGTYTIYGKGYSFGDDDHTCYYYNQFNGNYLIHSILYYPGTFNVKDGRLGMHLSNGCVRLSLDNAKWVYNNVPYSTRVVTY